MGLQSVFNNFNGLYRKTKSGEGAVFSVDDDDDDKDGCYRVFEDETNNLFDSYKPADVMMEWNLWVHKKGGEEKEEFDGLADFDASHLVAINLSEQEALMENVNANGTLKKMVS